MGRERLRAAVVFVFLAALVACGSRSAEPPRAGESRGAIPDLTGAEVLVLPVQRVAGLPGGTAGLDPDAELAFALQERGSDVQWILPSEIRSALETSPGVSASIDNLDVGIFLRTEVDRVGDPLFGDLRRLAALTGGSMALVPVQVRHRTASEESPPAVEFVAALLDARSGYVLWFGVVDGSAGDADDPATLASAADALARTLAR